MATTNSQLMKVTAPNINEVDYATKLQNSFEIINDNFKKIASLPFLQGAQGDSFETVTLHVFNTDSDKKATTLTDIGAALLNSIFNKSTGTYQTYFSTGERYDTVRTEAKNLASDINGVCVLDNIVDADGNLTNNELYFYAVKDVTDTINIQYMGQYFYFVDERIKSLNGQESTILSSFYDYTGFYQYVNDADEHGVSYHFHRLDILPTLYYDEDANDICWRFNGKDTGISAVGVKGANGDSSHFDIVKVLDSGTSQAQTVSYIMDSEGKWNKDISGLVDGQPIFICFYKTDSSEGENTMENFTLGVYKEEGNQALWDSNAVYTTFMNSTKITNFLFNLGKSSVNTEVFPRGLFLASDITDTTVVTGESIPDRNAHMFFTDKDENLNLARVKNVGATTPTQVTGATKDFKILNYDLKVGNSLKVSNALTVGGTANFNGYNSFNNYTVFTDETKFENEATFNEDTYLNGTLRTTNSSNIITAKSQITATVNGTEDVYLGLPIGSVTMWAGHWKGSCPVNWDICDGHIYSVTDSSRQKLYKEIGPFNGCVIKFTRSNNTVSYIFIPGSLWSVKKSTDDCIVYYINMLSPSNTAVYSLSNVTSDDGIIGKNLNSYFSSMESTRTSSLDIKSINAYHDLTDKSWRYEYEIKETETSVKSSIIGFAIPGIYTRTPFGVGTIGNDSIGVGEFGGERTHTLSQEEIPLASPTKENKGINLAGSYNVVTGVTYSGASPHNNMPPYFGINFIIKYQ